MAEGGGNKTEGLNADTMGSDFIFDFYCELCKDEGKHVEAAGFCVECGEYLCGVCYHAHPRNRQTRHHQLLDKDKMPKDTPLSSDRINKAVTSTCKRHAGELVKYYCKTHDALGCNTCFVTGHRNCPDVQSIVEKSENFLDSEEYTDLIQTLTSLDKKSRDMIASARAYTSKTKNSYTEVIKTVKLLREKVIEILDKLEQDIIAEADTLVSEEEKQMATISNNCSTLTESIETILAQFQSLQASRRVCQLYISMKENSEHIKAMQDKLHTTEEALVLRTLKFEPDRIFQYFTEKASTMGKISREAMKIAHVTDLATRTYDINGAALLSHNRLIIICDSYVGGMFDILDPQTNIGMADLMYIDGDPCEITAISRDKAVVTLHDSNKILFINVSDTGKLERDREISVDSGCCGVAYSKNRLVVSYPSTSKFEIMDLFGNIITRIENRNELFQCPGCVCVSKDGETIYVSDTDSNKVMSLTFDGVVKNVYTDPELKRPLDICVDHLDNVYVCGYDSRNVHMLTDDLAKIKIILTQVDGLTFLSHCQEKNRLYVGMYNKVKVFQLA